MMDEAERLRGQVRALRARVTALERRAAEAERASDSKTRFIGHVSHEFRTPLSSIIGFASLLAADEGRLSPGRRAEYQAIVLRNARHLLHVVNDILNLSKVEAGTLEVTLAPLRAGEVAASVVSSMRPAAEERGLALRLDDRALHLAVADAGRLRQVLLNLLDNAVKYSPPGAAVEVRVASDPAEVRIEVADRGHGVEAEDHALLFREFSRIPRPGMRVAGAGLGLALAKRLTEAMGGRIGVQSAAGKGSVFWLALPAGGRIGERAEAARPAAEAAARTPGGVVAVVDDDPDIRTYAAAVLEGGGFRAVTDDGGAGAAARLAAARPGAVFLDLNLEGRAGTEVLVELRAEPALAGVPVLAFTAASGEEDARRIREAGFDGVLGKPVEPADLLARAAAAIGEAPEPAEADDFLAPLRERFLAGLPDRLGAMEAAAGAGDVEALVREVHRLRGAAAGYGLPELSEAAARAEEALRAPGAGVDAPAYRALADRLRG